METNRRIKSKTFDLKFGASLSLKCAI